MYQTLELAVENLAISMPARDGETLIVKGDTCDQTLYIRSGIARAVTYSHEGDRQVMAFFFPGDVIGLPLTETHRYSVEAVSGLRFVRQSSEQFRMDFPVHDAEPGAMQQAIWREEKAFIARGLILGRGCVRARFAAFLLYLARHCLGADGLLHFAIPQGDIASFLATSPETVCRTLRKLRDEGLVAMRSREWLQIVDTHRLNLIADGE